MACDQNLPADIISEAGEINWEEYVEDTLNIMFCYQNPDGTPIDLTGSIVTCEIRRKVTDPEPVFVYSSAGVGVLTNAGTNHDEIQVKVVNTQTKTLGAGEFPYFVKTQDTAGTVNTIVIGKIALKLR